MGVKGYLVYVPFENVASMEYGNNGAPDRVTVATTPGYVAGPFEVRETVQDSANHRAAYEQAAADFKSRWGFDPTGAIDQAIAVGDYDLEGGTEEQRAFIREMLNGKPEPTS